MICKCVEEFEVKAREIYPEFHITGKSFMFSSMDYEITIDAEYKPVGKNKFKKLPVMATHCPFCGIKVKKD